MELKKLQCTSCGSAMEIKPGIDRVRCPFCGMNYLIERKETPQTAGRSKTVYGDNPADVLLVPLPGNTIFFNLMQSEWDYFKVKEVDLQYYFELSASRMLKFVFKETAEKLKLTACLAYVTNQTYMLEFGTLPLDVALLYYTGKDDITGKILTEKELAGFVEPKVTYRGKYGAFCKQYTGFSHNRRPDIGYDKKLNKKYNREYKTAVDSYIKDLHLDYTDEIHYLPVHREVYVTQKLFGDGPKRTRYWTKRYTSRRIYLQMDANTAKKYLSAEEMANIDKIGKVDCIADMAAKLYKGLGDRAKRALETRESISAYVSVYSDRACSIPFANYGMEQVEDKDVQHYIAVHIFHHISRMIETNGDIEWKVTYVNSGSISLVPRLKTVAVYNKWL